MRERAHIGARPRVLPQTVISSPAVRRSVARDPRGRASWVVPLLLCAAILLIAALAFNLAYLDTGGEQLPPSPGGGSPNPGAGGILDTSTASTLVLAVFAACGVTLIVLFILRRKQGIPVKRVLRPTTWVDTVAMLIAFSVFGILLVLWPRIVNGASFPGRPTSGTGNNSVNLTLVPSVAGIPLGYFLMAAILASVVAIALFFRVGTTLLRAAPSDRRARRHAAAEAVQAALEQLQVGGDVREVILACYARFCALLGSRGILAQETLTPRELEDLAVHRLSVSPASSDELTGLFEEARYSEHALGDADRDRAVRSLERIRADLEA